MKPCMEYESELADSPSMTLREAEALYEGRGRLRRTYERLAGRLEGRGLAFSLLGGYALILHGVRRFTEDIDVLIRAHGLTAGFAEGLNPYVRRRFLELLESVELDNG